MISTALREELSFARPNLPFLIHELEQLLST